MVNHKWIEKDDIITLYIHKYGFDNIPYSKNDIAEKIGVTVGSLNYRIGNFKAIEGKGKANHFAKLSMEVHKKYENYKEPQLCSVAFSEDNLSNDENIAFEGCLRDRTYLYRSRNRELVQKRKNKDDYRCQACGFRHKINGNYVIECHHMFPLAEGDERVTEIDELVSLCPTCHRIAHMRNPVYSIEEIKGIMTKNT